MGYMRFRPRHGRLGDCRWRTSLARLQLLMNLKRTPRSQVLWLALAVFFPIRNVAQTPSPPPTFDVASVKRNRSSAQANSNFPLGPGNAYTPNGGHFSATGFPLAMYINFAYKMMPAQIQQMATQLPDWAATDHYDIEARVQGDPGKDGMRALMRSLLAERFKLAVHEETKEMPVAALVLLREGKLGPMIQAHPPGTACPTTILPGDLTPDGRFPVLCGGFLQLPPSVRGRNRFGARDITLDFFARNASSVTASGRPMIDATGLTGTFDVSIEFSRSQSNEPEDLPFEVALKEQLGMKLRPQKAPQKVMVLDHVERPTEN
jgi:uncharacterized protein (TIGR03435 family)